MRNGKKKRDENGDRKKSKQSQTTLHNVLFVLPIIIIRRQNAYLITINTTTITIATIWERNRWNT